MVGANPIAVRSRCGLGPFNKNHGRFSASVLAGSLLVACVALTACHKKAQAKLPTAPAVAAKTPAQIDEQSCRSFVQSFYDWNWNPYAESASSVAFDRHTLPTIDTVLNRKPAVLSAELAQLLADEEKKKQATHSAGNLDFDPFWGNQNAQGKYRAGRVFIEGNSCKVSVPQGDVIAELKRADPSWVFVNFYYCFAALDSTKGRSCPDTDLVTILKK